MYVIGDGREGVLYKNRRNKVFKGGDGSEDVECVRVEMG